MPGPIERVSAAVRAVGSAYASVLFGTDPRVGLVLLGMTLLRPASGAGGLLAVVAANLTALALGYRIDAVRGGIYGYNALLLGLAVLAGRALDATTAALVVLAGASSALLTAVLGDLLHRSLNLPVLVLPFVILGSLLTPALDALGQHPGAAWLDDRPLLDPALPLPEPALALLRSLGALFFQSSPAAGLVVLGAALVTSRIGTVAVLTGVAAAAAMLRLFNGSTSPALASATTYNGALTALAIGAFLFVPSRASLVAAIGAAALSAWLSVTLSALLGKLGLPLLAWPFVLVALVTARALHLRAPDRPPFPPALPGCSPEANLDLATTLARRFGLPGPPRLALPVSGTWVVTQGVDGDHTHKGPWAHAWDLEVVDERGFPFRGDGARTEDYLCFGAPVLAPGTGTVTAVHEGAPDGKPGELDAARPWGNAVVIQHGPELFSVLAHLKQGSVAVRPGQYILAGQPVASCGASGRSPRPHLHLQAQRTPDLGAPAIPCRIVHYCVAGAGGGPSRYVHAGVPREGERLSPPAPSPVGSAFAALPVGLDIALDSEIGGGPVRLRSEVTLLGERYLRDLDRGDRLYFTLAHGDLAFTTHDGPTGTPLRALFLALPRLPFAAGPVAFEDRPPAAALLPRPLAAVHDLVRFLADPVETRAEVALEEAGDVLTASTRVGFGLGRRVSWRYRGRVEIDRGGLRALELLDERSPAVPLIRARRKP